MGYSKSKTVFFCGSVKNDLYLLLSHESFKIKLYTSPSDAISAAKKGSAVFIVSDTYPLVDETKRITQEILNIAAKKKLQLYIEYPASYPGLNLTQKPVETRLERGVITSDVFGPLFSLNEAAHATGKIKYKQAVDKLSNFLIRVQIKSKKHTDLDGGWFRGFDYNRWDYWASNSDAGWGAWCTLTGWSQSWIVATQIQVQENQSYWDITRKSGVNKHMQQTVKIMFGKE
ncbi:hypothetical protein GCM10028826_06320 [Mucilaginibacter boryungensis]